MRSFESKDHYYCTGRGRVFTGLIQPDPPLQCGETIRMDGKQGTVRGVEAFASIHGRDPGQPIGVLFREDS